MTGIEPALSAWEAGKPTVRWCFQAQRWPIEGLFDGLYGWVGARVGPEQLIKIARWRAGFTVVSRV
jgi:hypothetical protein